MSQRQLFPLLLSDSVEVKILVSTSWDEWPRRGGLLGVGVGLNVGRICQVKCETRRTCLSSSLPSVPGSEAPLPLGQAGVSRDPEQPPQGDPACGEGQLSLFPSFPCARWAVAEQEGALLSRVPTLWEELAVAELLASRPVSAARSSEVKSDRPGAPCACACRVRRASGPPDPVGDPGSAVGLTPQPGPRPPQSGSSPRPRGRRARKAQASLRTPCRRGLPSATLPAGDPSRHPSRADALAMLPQRDGALTTGVSARTALRRAVTQSGHDTAVWQLICQPGRGINGIRQHTRFLKKRQFRNQLPVRTAKLRVACPRIQVSPGCVCVWGCAIAMLRFLISSTRGKRCVCFLNYRGHTSARAPGRATPQQGAAAVPPAPARWRPCRAGRARSGRPSGSTSTRVPRFHVAGFPYGSVACPPS